MKSDAQRLRKSLERLKLAENTLIALASDSSRRSYMDAWIAHRSLLRELENERFSERRDRGDFD